MRSSTASRAVRNSTHTPGASARSRRRTSQPVDVGQHHVQHHRVGPEVLAGADRLLARARVAHLPALGAQDVGEDARQVGFVVDDEDAHRRAVGMAQAGGAGVRDWRTRIGRRVSAVRGSAGLMVPAVSLADL